MGCRWSRVQISPPRPDFNPFARCVSTLSDFQSSCLTTGAPVASASYGGRPATDSIVNMQLRAGSACLTLYLSRKERPMGILSAIFDRLRGRVSSQQETGAQPTTTASQQPTAQGAPQLQNVDIDKVLSDMA